MTNALTDRSAAWQHVASSASHDGLAFAACLGAAFTLGARPAARRLIDANSVTLHAFARAPWRNSGDDAEALVSIGCARPLGRTCAATYPLKSSSIYLSLIAALPRGYGY